MEKGDLQTLHKLLDYANNEIHNSSFITRRSFFLPTFQLSNSRTLVIQILK